MVNGKIIGLAYQCPVPVSGAEAKILANQGFLFLGQNGGQRLDYYLTEWYNSVVV